MKKRYVKPEVRATKMMEEMMQAASLGSIKTNLSSEETITVSDSGSGNPGRSREVFDLWEEE